jgi:hypothetical protein
VLFGFMMIQRQRQGTSSPEREKLIKRYASHAPEAKSGWPA